MSLYERLQRDQELREDMLELLGEFSQSGPSQLVPKPALPAQGFESGPVDTRMKDVRVQ